MDWKQYYNFSVVIWARSMDPKLVYTFSSCYGHKAWIQKNITLFRYGRETWIRSFTEHFCNFMDGKHGSKAILDMLVNFWTGTKDKRHCCKIPKSLFPFSFSDTVSSFVSVASHRKEGFRLFITILITISQHCTTYVKMSFIPISARLRKICKT